MPLNFFRAKKKRKTELFKEIKGRIKLADQSVPYKDKNYTYWTRTTKKGNYSIKLRKKNNSNKNEVIWNGDKEKKKFNSSYFGIGTINVSNNDKYLNMTVAEIKKAFRQKGVTRRLISDVDMDDFLLSFSDQFYNSSTINRKDIPNTNVNVSNLAKFLQQTKL